MMHERSHPPMLASALPPACLDQYKLGLPTFIAIARSIDTEIGMIEGDIAHFRFEATLAGILGTEIDSDANMAAIHDAEQRLRRLREEHAEAVQRVDALLADRGA